MFNPILNGIIGIFLSVLFGYMVLWFLVHILAGFVFVATACINGWVRLINGNR